MLAAPDHFAPLLCFVGDELAETKALRLHGTLFTADVGMGEPVVLSTASPGSAAGLAQGGRAKADDQCPLIRVKQT
jgi:hypothetical protein